MKALAFVTFVYISLLFSITSAAAQKMIQIGDAPGPDYRASPAGWIHKDCAYEIPEGAIAKNTPNGGMIVEDFDGNLIFEAPPCPYEQIPIRMDGTEKAADRNDRVDNGVEDPAIGHTWIERAWMALPVNPTGYQYYTQLKGQWTVPNDPTDVNGHFFFFNGIQSADSIVQPVLQWGCCSSAGGGSYWGITAYWWQTGGNLAYGALRQVQPGDVLYGEVIGTNCDASGDCIWSVSIHTSYNYSALSAYAGTLPYTDAVPGALESGHIDNCNQLPSGTQNVQFHDTYIYMPGTAGNPSSANYEVGSNAYSGIVTGGLSPNCGFGATPFARGVTLSY